MGHVALTVDRHNDDYITVSPRQPPVESVQLCVTDAYNAAVQLTECTSLRDYHKSNGKCQKTEFVFEFINQTLFNIRR